MNLTRDLFIPAIDLNAVHRAYDPSFVADGYDLRRIDKSTIFALAFNPQETTSGFIDAPNDSTSVTSYQPELPQEIILESTNPIYEHMLEFCMAMPTGSSAVVPCLIVTPDKDGQAVKGHLWKDATISPGELNTVDGKLSFTMKLNGAKEIGTVTNENGTLTFTPDGEEVESTSVEGGTDVY